MEALARRSAVVRRAMHRADEQLMPFAEQLPPRPPADRVWRAIEQRVSPATRQADAPAGGWWRSLVFWRSGALVAMGLFLALGLMQLAPRWGPGGGGATAGMGGLAQTYVAVLSDRGAAPQYLISAQRYQRDVHIKVLSPQALPEGKVLRLWALAADGAASALGTLPLKEKGRLELVASAEDVLSKIPFLGISIEPADAPPGARPSGEFVYRGPCVKLW